MKPKYQNAIPAGQRVTLYSGEQLMVVLYHIVGERGIQHVCWWRDDLGSYHEQNFAFDDLWPVEHSYRAGLTFEQRRKIA